MRNKAAWGLLGAWLGGGAAWAGPAALSQADVAFYLSVMRTAADRVQHPTAADERALAEADALNREADSGQATAMTEQQVEDMTRALELRAQMDEVIVTERHLNAGRYDTVRDRIEEEAGELHCDPNAPDVLDRALLIPQLTEITQLMRTVRGPGALACGDG